MYIVKIRPFLLALLLTFWFQNLTAQEDYAFIKKNLNVRAKDLVHDLNATKDTLILQSDKKIDYVYSINSDYKRELDTYVFENALKVPLSKFTKGKHVFVVGQNHMKIVFVIQIHDHFSKIALVAEEKRTTIDN